MKLIDLFFSARPLLHLPVWSVYLVSLNYHLELSGESFQWADLLNLALLSVMVAGAYFVNQIYDAKGDELNNKLGFIQRGIVSAKEFWMMFLLFSLSVLIVSSLVSMTTFGLFAQFFLLGFIYSAPPLKLKDRPWPGLIANAYCFGILVPLVVMPELSIHNVGLMALDLSLYFFFTVGAVHVFTTIPDARGDKETGKRTIANSYTASTVRLIALGLLLISLVVAVKSGRIVLIILSSSASVAAIATLMKSNNKRVLLAAKLPILLLTLVAGYYYPFYLLFILALFILTRIYYAKRFGIIYPRLT